MNLKNRINAYAFVFLIAILALPTIKCQTNASNQTKDGMTLEEFNKKIQGKDKPVLVYFSANWCAVCAKMKPLIEKTQIDYAQKIDLLKIDTDIEKRIAEEYEIDALPVIVMYKNGFRQWVYVGLIDEKTLFSKINPYLTK